jgi:hypothetical protein
MLEERAKLLAHFRDVIAVGIVTGPLRAVDVLASALFRGRRHFEAVIIVS